MTIEAEDEAKLFQSIGLSEQKAKETIKNKQVSNNLKLAIIEVSKVYKRFSNNASFLLVNKLIFLMN